jgi:hypothetical protein
MASIADGTGTASIQPSTSPPPSARSSYAPGCMIHTPCILHNACDVSLQLHILSQSTSSRHRYSPQIRRQRHLRRRCLHASHETCSRRPAFTPMPSLRGPDVPGKNKNQRHSSRIGKEVEEAREASAYERCSWVDRSCIRTCVFRSCSNDIP